MPDSLPLYDFDKIYLAQYPVICGTDEAGRGPLAGDVFAAAVILNHESPLGFLDDSKKLSPKKRDFLYDQIIENAISYSIASASVDEIESLNILNAAMLAMRRAVSNLTITPSFTLADGNCNPLDSKCAIPIIKGDSLSASIAAASILAKVARDRFMLKMAQEYPQYAFEKHKGYPTKLHYERIAQYGPCDIHRKSFLKKFYAESKK